MNTQKTKPTVVNLPIAGATKTRVNVGTDDNGNDIIILLNLDDQGILERLEEGYAKLTDYAKQFKDIKALEKGVGEVGDKQNIDYYKAKSEINSAAKEVIDNIFQYPVCDACSAGGTLFDIVREAGKERFDVIISGLSSLYTDSINEAIEKRDKKREAHTKKYTKKK